MNKEEELEEPKIDLVLPSLPKPDSTKEPVDVDWDNLQWVYKEDIKPSPTRQRPIARDTQPSVPRVRKRRTIRNIEQQIIIDGKRYKVRTNNGDMQLIEIR